MNETIYFNDKGTNYKAEWLEENYPENPRDENFQTNLGTMVFTNYSKYNLGDKQVDYFDSFFKEQLSEKDFSSEEVNQLEKLSEKELYQKWKETKACVIPLSLYEHSGLTVHASSEEYNVYDEISGFIYVDKDNPEFLDYGNDEEEAKKWVEGVLKTEIEEYAAYLEGDVHNVKISYFDKEKMDWIDNDYGTMIYGSSLEENLQSHGFDTSNKLDKNKVFVLENSVNSEFKAATGKKYIEAVKKELADFDNNPKLAAKSVSKQWQAKEDVNVEETDRLNRWTLKKQALNEYFKDNGCDSPEKIFAFLAEKVGVRKVEHNLEPLNVKDEKLHAYISVINNPSRSDNHGIGKLLLVDEQNKRMALLNSPSHVLSKSNIDAKITTLSSAKKVDEKASELLRYGFKSTEIGNGYLKPYQKDIPHKSMENKDRER